MQFHIISYDSFLPRSSVQHIFSHGSMRVKGFTSTCQKSEVNDYPVNEGVTCGHKKDLTSVSGILDRNYSYKSGDTQIPHELGANWVDILIENQHKISLQKIFIEFQENNLNLNRDSNSDLHISERQARVPVQVQNFLLKFNNVNVRRHKL